MPALLLSLGRWAILTCLPVQEVKRQELREMGVIQESAHVGKTTLEACPDGGASRVWQSR